MAIAYSLHLGSDKNKKASSRGLAKKTLSGSTSLTNNGIQNAGALTKADKHNYRKYDNDQTNIEIVKGSDSLVKDVKELYLEEFETARTEYNSWQTRSDRKIDNYFEHVSTDKTRDLACEIIIELGNKDFWNGKDDECRKKMTAVYKKQVDDLELLVPNFKVCSAIIHYDETSPHMHIVGVPIKDNLKNGMTKQVGKSTVFNKVKLIEIQDQMRALCIEEYNQEYEVKETLKEKQKGRNQDINVRDMEHYSEMREELDKNQETLKVANDKSDKLNNYSDELKESLTNLKQNAITKNYSLDIKTKENIENYINEVNTTNKAFKDLNKLKETLSNVGDDLKDVKNLQESNKALNVRVKALTNKIKEKDNQINELEKLVDHFKNMRDQAESLYYYIKGKFDKLINFIGKSIIKNPAKYKSFAEDLRGHGIFNSEDIKAINKASESIDKENEKASEEFYKNKEKDDFEL
jgi:hypothetical protein